MSLISCDFVVQTEKCQTQCSCTRAENRFHILQNNSDRPALVFRWWTGMGRTSEVKETCNHAIGISWESLNRDRQGLKIQSSERWSVQITLESAMCLRNRKIGKKQEGGEGVWNPRPIFQFQFFAAPFSLHADKRCRQGRQLSMEPAGNYTSCHGELVTRWQPRIRVNWG